MQIITGEPRRWRSDAEKLEILAEAEALGSVTAAARRYGVNPSQVFAWRRLFRDGELLPDEPVMPFAPVALITDAAPDFVPSVEAVPPPAPEPRMISVTLGASISMHVPGDADPALAAAIAKALAPFAAARS